MPARTPGIGAPALVGPAPEPLSFRTEDYPGGMAIPLQRAPWGKLLYAVSGVAEFVIAGERMLSPPAYAIWIPPETPHESRASHNTRYAAAYVHRTLCGPLPDKVCTLALSPVLKAVMADFAARAVTLPLTAEDQRLAQVLLDQICLAPRYDSYLPFTGDALLGPVLAALQAAPGDRRSLAEWARQLGTTERTLSRRCQQMLGLSFQEWRQRLKLLTAISLLEDGCSIQATADQLGYGAASAFIAMFRQLTGASPTRMISKSTSC
ncbi:helix-turn-helix domain-containing protein [Methylocapsa sp. S129]|uniref:AraC family transcriptional regulator n=1 Tax=Methylocapsa sp. S129 TaxID=1641869 RepID=UPI00131C0D25|nr:helix-turn-helix transcriptional regulator [Methylocapsa sp. S129]